MAHWLDDEINKQNARIGKDLKIEKEGLELNVNENRIKIEEFMKQLTFLFDKLNSVIEEKYLFSKEQISNYEVIECERSRFDAINATQSTVFMRRADIIICDKPGEIVFELFRAKRASEKDDWKFHDEQKIVCNMDKLNDETVYDLIDWFAWKNYFPRTLRKD